MPVEIESATMCFACGADNPIGLKIDFSFDGETCSGEFTPDENHVSWEDTVHGGIIFAALDDVTGNIPYLQGLKAHTARSEIRYRQPLRIGETVKLTGWTDSTRGRLLNLKGEARRKSDNVLVAECASSFLLEK